MCYCAAVLRVVSTQRREINFVPQQGSPQSSGIAEKTKDIIRIQCSLSETIENMKTEDHQKSGCLSCDETIESMSKLSQNRLLFLFVVVFWEGILIL